jgi:hypothetical protein
MNKVDQTTHACFLHSCKFPGYIRYILTLLFLNLDSEYFLDIAFLSSHDISTLTMPESVLTQEQKDNFMKYGYLRLTDCFSREKAAEWTKDVWARLGYSPTDKSTWTRERINMPYHRTEPVQTFAPKAWLAICELLGGEDRVAEHSAVWNDGLIVNLGTDEWEGKWPDPRDLQNWHVDGDFFVHFLDSGEQGLLVIPLFTDIQEHAGGTMICTDAIKHMAKHLVLSRSKGFFNERTCQLTALSSTITLKACRLGWYPAVSSRRPVMMDSGSIPTWSRNATNSTR